MERSIGVRYSRRCYRCGIELLEQDRWNYHCPRCGRNIEFDCPEDGIVDEKARKSWQVATDLGRIFTNWGKGFIRLLDESGQADYSLLDEFASEVITMAFPYIQWMMNHKNPILQKDGIEFIRYVLNDVAESIFLACQQYEELQRLTGEWGEDDQETKEYWFGRLSSSEVVGETLKKIKN